MIKEYELYHGAFLRSLLVDAKRPISMKVDDTYGLINTFVLDEKVSIFIKHSSSRLAPWAFNFHGNHIEELLRQAKRYDDVFVALICGKDGVASISLKDFVEAVKATSGQQIAFRVDRSKRSMYSVFGNASEIANKVARGNKEILEALAR